MEHPSVHHAYIFVVVVNLMFESFISKTWELLLFFCFLKERMYFGKQGYRNTIILLWAFMNPFELLLSILEMLGVILLVPMTTFFVCLHKINQFSSKGFDR